MRTNSKMEKKQNGEDIIQVKAPVQKRSRETRRRIVKAARSLFTELGFEETTTHLIAARAGLSVGGIYAHFKNKEVIFLDILEMRSKEAYQATLDCIDTICSDNMPLGQALEFLFHTWYQVHMKHGKLNQEMQKFCIMNRMAARIHDRWEKAEGEKILALMQKYQNELQVDDLNTAVVVIARATHEVFQYLYRERDRVDAMAVLSSLIVMVKKFLLY